MCCTGYDALGGIRPAIGSPRFGPFGTGLEQVNNKMEAPSNLLNKKILKDNGEIGEKVTP